MTAKRPRGRPPPRALTPRQRQVLDLVVRGLGNKAIATELKISEQAAKEHVSNLLRRFGVSSRASLAEVGTHLQIMGVTDADTSWLPYLFQSAPIGVQVFRGPDHRIVASNAVARRAADRDVIGLSLREGYPLTADRIGPMLDHVFAAGEPHIEYEFSGTWVRDGQTRASYSDFVLQPISGPDGTVTDVVLFGADVTERVVARRRAEQLSAEQLAIFDLMNDGVIVADATGAIVKVNEAARQIAGAPIDLAKGVSERVAPLQFRQPDGRPVKLRDVPLMRALAGEDVPWTEYITRTAHQGDVRMRVAARPMRSQDGSINGAVVVFRPARPD